MDIRFQYLINEIISVAPATASEYYTKQKAAKERLEKLKAELIEKIDTLEKKAKENVWIYDLI